jgi:dipeptidyl aminopeptidase/acylaminoacyl peptidase
MLQEEIYIKSTVDETMQPSLFYRAEGKEKRPLLVGLHTWSHNRSNMIQYLLKFAEEQNFSLLMPEFRGPNLTSNPNKDKACGSIYAKQDIKDAIDHIVANESVVDKNNIFLVGLSGGGHMAMLMAGFCPEYFRAIAAFAPISDLERWKSEAPSYVAYVDYCCNADPEEMLKRSAINYYDTIAKANMKIFHGRLDEIVPFKQSLDFFNEMLVRYPKARLYLDIFDGGHQFDINLCKNWLFSQYRAPKTEEITG